MIYSCFTPHLLLLYLNVVEHMYIHMLYSFMPTPKYVYTYFTFALLLLYLTLYIYVTAVILLYLNIYIHSCFTGTLLLLLLLCVCVCVCVCVHVFFLLYSCFTDNTYNILNIYIGVLRVVLVVVPARRSELCD